MDRGSLSTCTFFKAFGLEEEEGDVEEGIQHNRGEVRRTAAKEQVDSPAPTTKPSSAAGGKQSPPATACTLRRLLLKNSHLLVAPLLAFCIIAALSAFGIMRASTSSYNSEANHAWEAAVIAADGIAKELSSATRAALSLAAVVRLNPNWSFLESNFEVLANELFRQSMKEGNRALRELALIPFGRVTANYGTIHGGNHGDGNHGDGNNDDGNHVKGNNDQGNSTGNSDHGNHGDGNINHGNHGNSTSDGHTIDLFSPERIEETGPYRSMEQRGLTVSDPIPFAGTQERAFAARYPVFFNDTDEDESWGHPDNITHPTGCSGPPCYNPATRKKFWGFIGGVVSAEPLLRGDNVHLQRLLPDGFSYSLTTSFLAGTGGRGTLVFGGRSPEKGYFRVRPKTR